MSVPRYRFFGFIAPAGGVSGGQLITMYANAKPNSRVPYCIANEYICSRLGLFVGLPVPPGGILEASGILWYASMNFNVSGIKLPPVDVPRCLKDLGDLSAGLLIFDVFIQNDDRHRENFAVDFGVAPPQMNVFDFSHTLFGTIAGKGSSHLLKRKNDLGILGPPNRHALLDHIDSDAYFDKWITRISQIPNYIIEDVARDAGSMGLNSMEVSCVADALKYRRDNLRAIIKAHQAEFKGIKQWKLW